MQVKQALSSAEVLSKSLKKRYLELVDGQKVSDEGQRNRHEEEEGLEKGREQWGQSSTRTNPQTTHPYPPDGTSLHKVFEGERELVVSEWVSR